MASPLPDKIGRYQILERVGRGGMGVLYRGHDPVLDREVAVKVMLTDFAEDFELLRPRFYREAKAVARLQHRNIVTIFEFAEEANQPHIVMEFLRGQPLADRMVVSPPLTLDDKLDIVAQLCSGLGYAHSQGVVHRDVKPANVFLLNDGTVKLLDFGIAKLTTSTMTRQGDVLGSASYMSPEQVSGSESVDGRADVWSTGVVLYELLAGHRPFEAETPTNVIVKILKEDPPPIESVISGVPKQLAALVARALEKDPDRRVARADEFARELQWIRKALQASGELPPMEETRFASTQVLKALHEDRQKQSSVTARGRTLADAPVVIGVGAGGGVPADTTARPGTATLANAAAAAAAGPGNKGILIAALAAAVVIGGAGTAVWMGGWLGGDTNTGSERRVNPPPPKTDPGPPPDARKATPELNVAIVPTEAGAKSGASGSTAKPDPSSGSKIARDAAGEGAATKASPTDTGKPSPDPGTTSPDTSKTLAAEGEKAATKAPPAVMVKVTMEGAYPFQVMEGSRVVSDAGRSHDFQHGSGRTVRVVAADVFLDQAVRIDGGAERVFDYTAPGLGMLDIRAQRGDCRVLVGKRDLGFLPLPPFRVVAGDYEVSLSCPDGVNPRRTTTVTQGFTARVLFK